MVDSAADANRESALANVLAVRLKAIADSGALSDAQAERLTKRLHVAAIQLGQESVRANRPLTADIRKLILLGISAGLPMTVAANLAGVARSSFYDALSRDSKLREAYERARLQAVEHIEDRLSEWIDKNDPETGGMPTMAQVQAARLRLEGADPRYRKGGGAPAVSATVTAADGSQVRAAVGLDIN